MIPCKHPDCYTAVRPESQTGLCRVHLSQQNRLNISLAPAPFEIPPASPDMTRAAKVPVTGVGGDTWLRNEAAPGRPNVDTIMTGAGYAIRAEVEL